MPLDLAFIGSPGVHEFLLLFLVILVFFGPRRLPEIARMIGRTVDQLRRAANEFRDQVMKMDQSDDLGTSAREVTTGSDASPYQDVSAGTPSDEDERKSDEEGAFDELAG